MLPAIDKIVISINQENIRHGFKTPLQPAIDIEVFYNAVIKGITTFILLFILLNYYLRTKITFLAFLIQVTFFLIASFKRTAILKKATATLRTYPFVVFRNAVYFMISICFDRAVQYLLLKYCCTYC